MRIRLQRKVFLGFALAFLPMLGLLLWEFRRDVRWLESSLLEDQLVTADAVAVAVDRQLDTAVGIGWAVSFDPRVRAFDSAQLDRYLMDLVTVYPQVTSLGVFDAAGTNRGYGSTSARAKSPRFSVADRSYFQQAMATNLPAVSNVLELRAAGVVGIVVGVPIRDETGRPMGIVTIAMDTDDLERQYEEVRVRPGQSILLADRDGRLAAHTGQPHLTPRAADEMRELPAVVSALAGVPTTVPSFVSPLDGDQRLGAFVRTARYNWVVGITMPRRVALAPAYARLRGELLGFAAIFALTIALSEGLARVLVRPVLALEDAARALGEGDLLRRVRIETGDEVERLGASFNEMADRLQQRNQALVDAQAALGALNAQLEKRVEDRTAALEAANRELESFSYSVSHDLRAPLRAVDGFIGIVLQDFADGVNPEAAGYLLRAQAASRRMSGLIDGFLALSRAARAPLTRVRVDIGALARASAQELADAAPGRVEWRVGDLPACEGDPVLLRQVLVNLIGNALKYSRDRDPPRVDVGFDPGPPPSYYVRDNGVGFDMSHAQNLFQPFERLHDSQQFEGTGVGLAIVQRVIARHGGRIWAESTPGEGATFRFTLGEARE
ncbi:MAG: cache domain-containing protein [Pseudomonadota bacterium]|nr:cache domain-containing protein [Pseudomonadota bacterium]